MAGPVSHIIYALLILPLLPPTINHKEFIIGTSFPDIRYLANIERKKTHIEPVSWDIVVNEPSSFRAGMLFHNLVDEVRAEYFAKEQTIHLKSSNKLYRMIYPSVMKNAEDALLYEKSNQWVEIVSTFDTILEEEKHLIPQEEIIKEWHRLIKSYCSQKPGLQNFLGLVNHSPAFKIKILKKVVPLFVNVEKMFSDLLVNQEFAVKLEEFYNHFPLLVVNAPVYPHVTEAAHVYA
jgi:hypothetical protein